jgi:hypothetical protein
MSEPKITPAQYRATLEKQRDEILQILGSKNQDLRAQLVKELRHIVDELNALDEARSWVNSLDTQPRIDLGLSKKVYKRF